MTYYILLNENEDLWKEPEALSDVKIIDEKGSKYSITEFLDTIKKLKIMLDN